MSNDSSSNHARCCGGCNHGVSRREVLTMGGIALSALAMGGLAAQSVLAAVDGGEIPMGTPRKALVVKPILTYETPARRPQTSWRNWGGIQGSSM